MWHNGEETILAVSKALINSGAGSQGRWHQSCGTASHPSVWTWVGVFLAGRSAPLKEGRLGQDWDQQVWQILAKLTPLQCVSTAGALNRGGWPKCPWVTHGNSTSQTWAVLRIHTAPRSAPLSPDRPPYLASGLLGTDTPLPGMKQDSIFPAPLF